MSKKAEQIYVVINKGRTLQHNGQVFGPTHRVGVSEDEAARLVRLGTAVLFSSLLGDSVPDDGTQSPQE